MCVARESVTMQLARGEYHEYVHEGYVIATIAPIETMEPPE